MRKGAKRRAAPTTKIARAKIARTTRKTKRPVVRTTTMAICLAASG